MTDRNKRRARAGGGPARKRGNPANRSAADRASRESAPVPRLTYRTARVLSAIAAHPGAPNRQIGLHAEISDEGQICKLLQRLKRSGLVYGRSSRRAGLANAWYLTANGVDAERYGARHLDQLPHRRAGQSAARNARANGRRAVRGGPEAHSTAR